MSSVKVLALGDERGKDMKEFMLNIQDSMDTQKRDATWHQNLALNFSIDVNILETVPHYKYLGTYVDSELNFTRQSNETIKLVSYKLYFLTKIKNFLNTDLLIRLYKTYIQPYFDYNNIFLENTYFNQYDKLVRLQKCCLRRCLPENVRVNKDDVYTLTDIDKLAIDERANVHLLKLMYKRAQDHAYLNTVGRARLHDAPVLNVPFPNNETFKKIIIFRGSTAWNLLPANERNIPRFDRFKSMLKNKLRENIM